MGNYYDFDGNQITVLEWGNLFEKMDDRIVAVSKVGDCDVSTVWIGMDHRFDPNDGGEPLIYETIIFGLGEDDEYLVRYSTREEAILGHIKAVEHAASGLPTRAEVEAAINLSRSILRDLETIADERP